MNIKTGEIVNIPEGTDPGEDMVEINGELLTPKERRDKKVEKALKGRALKVVYRALLRGTRSKYFPHVGEKQKAKIAKQGGAAK